MKHKIFVFHKPSPDIMTHNETWLKKGDIIPPTIRVFNTRREAEECALSYESNNGYSSYFQYIKEIEIDL